MALESFIINSVSQATGNVDVTFTADGGVTRRFVLNLGAGSFSDAPSLARALKQYYRAFRLGRAAQQAAPVGADVTAIVGQAQAIDPNDPDI